MAKVLKKSRRKQPVKSVSSSSKQCEESLKNFCKQGSFSKEIHIREQTMTPLLQELLAFRPRPQWK